MIPDRSVSDVAVERWTSWRSSMIAALGHTSGPVLEVGVGHYSTPWLHQYCLAMDRQLVSVEDNPDWFEEFLHQFGAPNHHFQQGSYDVLIPSLKRTRWGVVFLDHSPGERRGKDAGHCLELSEYVVIHDFEGNVADIFNREVQLTALTSFCVDNVVSPPTLTVSQNRRLPPPR